MLNEGAATNGRLSEQPAEFPPSQTDFSFASARRAPVLASHDCVGALTLPFPGHEQLGLQQSQYPVVHVPRVQLLLAEPPGAVVLDSGDEVRDWVVGLDWDGGHVTDGASVDDGGGLEALSVTGAADEPCVRAIVLEVDGCVTGGAVEAGDD